MLKPFGRNLPLILLMTAATLLLVMDRADADGRDGTVTVTLHAGAYQIEQTERGDEIFMEGFGRNLVPGKPDLPAKIFAVAIPYGAEVEEVLFEAAEGIDLPGRYHVPAAPLPRVIGQEDPVLYARDQQRFQSNYDETYLNDTPYPASAGEMVRRAAYRKYNLVDVRFTPFSYLPQSGKLTLHPSMTVKVRYTEPERMPLDPVMGDNLPRTEKVARDIVCNYDQAQAWYPQSGSNNGRGLYDFVIITLDSFVASVQPLVDWETAKGRTVNVVTTTWISSNYNGYDLAEQMRNFLRDKYPSIMWGIEDVLLVGGYANLPMRRCSQDLGYGTPETDYYYAELSLADSQSWDKDGDHQWGEDTDPIDFYAEVNVGRIPWGFSTTIQHICEKSAAFEANQDPDFKKSMLLLGAYFWADTDNAKLMEYKSNATTHPWMAGWNLFKMYEKNVDYSSSYPCDMELLRTNVRDEWSTGKYAFVNWAGHGSPTSSHIYGLGAPAFITSSDCAILNDDYPAIIFADACSNSDTDYTNLGKSMLQQGAVGFVGATKVALGCPGWSNPNHGSTQSLDYYFTTSVTSENYTQGAAHQYALRTMYVNGLWNDNKYETFEWGALWGNPNLGLGEVVPPALTISFPQGVPEGVYPPGPEITVRVQITNGQEVYQPGTGTLYYRFGPGAFSPVALTALGGGLFEGVIPNTCPGDQPEFYFSAQGSSGTTVLSPYNAPSSTYGFDVCFVETMMSDNFQTDKGWTVTNLNVSTGAFERADPVATDGQPENDHSAQGTLCYVTGASGGGAGDDDLDGGPTRLISPVLNLAGSDALVSFYYYFYHTDYGTQQPLKVHVTNDGSNWVSVVDLTHNPAWTAYSFQVSDFVTPTAQVQVRFTATDNPNDDVVEALIDDFEVKSFNYAPSLWADHYDFSAGMGALIQIDLDAGSSHAGRDYLLLASFSGTFPGLPLPDGGAVLPLNWDGLTDWVLNHLGTPACLNFLGVLDGTGEAAATFNTNGSIDPKFIGRTITFAYLLGPDPVEWDFASNPIGVDIEL